MKATTMEARSIDPDMLSDSAREICAWLARQTGERIISPLEVTDDPSCGKSDCPFKQGGLEAADGSIHRQLEEAGIPEERVCKEALWA